MALELDERQRAMLLEMGVRVWLPGASFATEAVERPERMPSAVAAKAPVAPVRPAPVLQVSVPHSTPTQPHEVSPMADTPWADLDWAQLVAKAQTCADCGLCAGRTHSTLAGGGAQAQTSAPCDWLVVGDPPDEDEDRAGHAFAGQAGVLMDNMLKAMGASRTGIAAQGAYLSNVTKCRPPHGRNPQPAELQACAAFLQREIALVQPKVILALGRFAIQLLLADRPDVVGLPLGKQRGAVYRYLGIPVVVSYHPRVLLRAPADKGKAWADLCLAMDVRDGLV